MPSDRSLRQNCGIGWADRGATSFNNFVMATGNPTNASPSAGPPDASRPSASFRPAMVVTPTLVAAQPTPAVTAAAPPPETAAELLGRLRRLHDEGRVAVAVDLKRLMHIDSPVGFEADSNRWAYGLLLLTLALWYFFGYRVGIAAAVVSVGLYYSLGRMYVRRKIERRVRGKAMDDEAHWRKLWSFGGVTLHEAGGAEARCAAPADNWMEFVRRLSRD